ncbi:MAG TPA: hypothetical protein VLW06_04515 [Terriglobales bacterium]|nr:hypothetical protein [Terriglobales bacterium]
MPPKNAPTPPAPRTDAVTAPTAGTPVTAPVTPITPITPAPIPPVSVSPGGTTSGTTPTPLSPSSPSVSTTSPTVAVTVPDTSGQVTFSLVVTDNLGVQSQPATVTVNIQSPPVAVLTTSTPAVSAGGPIELSGSGSSSSGNITNYTFSLVPSATPAPTPVTPT